MYVVMTILTSCKAQYFHLFVSFFFFFKQKTAYEMRISDWSSDVCSSDLSAISTSARAFPMASTRSSLASQPPSPFAKPASYAAAPFPSPSAAQPDLTDFLPKFRFRKDHASCVTHSKAEFRSEEHTSELQSLMRLSYAVFCLKTKKQQQP